jgi:hypothetical protein
MPRTLFVSLPVADLSRSIAFFEALDFPFDPAFASDQGACLAISEHARVMLVARPVFAGLTTKPIADAHAVTEALLALSCDSRDAVDALVARALAAGGTTPNEAQDHGFMYDHGFEDLDGHMWGVFCMTAAPPAGA